MVTQVPLDCELCLCPDNLGNKDVNTSVSSSSQEHAAPQMPVKKQTRQWAAWTRQEEESFFVALRQVGKNFEKITSRVQSKNKDQVRHYYYRLVRRMNKLLGPELCLDAKNSKDTNAAMLRWWSLLEKYSCKASKLHLKPRRFKIFVETLENQLLKDRKKITKKRLSTGENNSSIQNVPASNQVRASGQDNPALKMVLLDSQNIQKVGTGKGALFKRHVNIGMTRANCKVDQASAKTVKHRRKTGPASAAAYKKWEKAAIAGVSLVADAAEHLERADTDKENENYQETPGQDGLQLVGEAAQSIFKENNINNPAKLKLQLFPVDEHTQRAVERDHHNPHLELTLSTRKKISSILEHLNRKWGNSGLLHKELMLFPYWAQRENLVGYQRWNKDSTHCAADVYYLIGSPSVFRLRYGWFSRSEIESATAQALSYTNINEPNLTTNTAAKQNSETENASVPMSRKASGDLAVIRQVENTKDTVLSAGEWADSLTNISVGELLTEPTQNVDCTGFPTPLASNCLQQIPFSCDSFDAAIAAHIYKHQNSQPGITSHAPSIWDAEETCDAFSFQKTGAFCGEDHNLYINDPVETLQQANMTSPSLSDHDVEDFPDMENLTNNNHTCGDVTDECKSDHPSENPTKDFGGLTDIYWPDSLGPLDLEMHSCRYQSNDLILSDSLSGLNRLIANSLDAFQSCSFFGSDKKEPPPPPPVAETRQTASFPDFKIESKLKDYVR